jgi:acyl-CoA reductase-like NAD-dependent aldehyde dehydrogenase
VAEDGRTNERTEIGTGRRRGNLLSNAVPFGGMRQSGMGRELGLAGIKEYLGQSNGRGGERTEDDVAEDGRTNERTEIGTGRRRGV